MLKNCAYNYNYWAAFMCLQITNDWQEIQRNHLEVRTYSDKLKYWKFKNLAYNW